MVKRELMTNSEFVELLDQIWGPEEGDEELWQEDFNKRHQEWLYDKDDLEANLEEFAPDQLIDTED